MLEKLQPDCFFEGALKNDRMTKVIGRTVTRDSICGHISSIMKREIVRTRKTEVAIWILLFFFFVMGGIMALLSQNP